MLSSNIDLKPATLWLLLLFLVGCGRINSPPPPPTRPAVAIETTIRSSGEERGYRLFVPAGDPTLERPLLVAVHGLGGSAALFDHTTQATQLAQQEGFIVVYPEGNQLTEHQQGWYIEPGSADVTFIRDLVTHLQTEYPIDPDRIYATGLSNGGGMVERLACDAADLFTAVAPVNGAYTFHKQCQPSQPISLMMWHGLDDLVVPYSGSFQTPHIGTWAGRWAERNGCSTVPVTSNPHDNVAAESWNDCRNNVETILYGTTGSGHAWPGSTRSPNTIDATAAIWQFFNALD